MRLEPTTIGAIRRDVAVELIVTRLGSKRSAWNAADIRGEAEKLVASLRVVTERGIRVELVEDLTARTIDVCRPLLDRTDVPEHVRALTSERVLAVEADLNTSLAQRADRHVVPDRWIRYAESLDAAQRQVIAALAGEAGLLVIEGAAGTGKTTALSAAREALEARDRRLVVVTPTLKAAQAAQQQVDADAFSAAWLVHQHGYRWDEDGRWTHVETPRQEVDLLARLMPGDVLLVDETGMLDQDTARALLTIADGASATVALLGDRHQLPAVGRGGVLDLAARLVRPEAHLELESVHRFTDPVYADLSLLMRSGERSGEVFDALLNRGEIVIHPSKVELVDALADVCANGGELVIADTREQVTALNAAIRDRRAAVGEQDGERRGEPVTSRGERIGLGDGIATRRNDRDLRIANRDTWTVTGIGDDGSLLVVGRAGQRQLPADYVEEHVELAYATTVYGAQGDTVDSAHLVAESIDDAREQWVGVFSRDRADLGPTHAAELAADDIDRYGPQAPQRSFAVQAALLGAGGARRHPEPPPAMAPSPGRGLGR